MAVFELQDVSFAFSGAGERQALSHLSFTLEEGAFYLLCGPSGGGKSTLLRLMKHLAAPKGRQSGTILYQGVPVQEMPPARLAHEIGFVFQNVDSQIISDHVAEELAFGLENLGLPPEKIASRIAETASFFGIEPYFESRTDALSGGEKQLLNLAGVLAAQPRVLLLDEPLSQLDPIARQDFLAQLRRVNRELGMTILLSEHHLEDIFEDCDRVLLLEEGTLHFCGEPRQAAGFLLKTGHPLAKALPASARLSYMLHEEELPLLEARGLRRQLKQGGLRLRERPAPQEPPSKEPLLRCREVSFGYERGRLVLSDLDVTVYRGECLAVVGGNGAGKSTLLHLLSGNLKPVAGKIKRRAPVAYLPQNPYTSFVADTLREEFQLLLTRTGGAWERLEALLSQYPLFSFLRQAWEQNPMDLSGGEAQKAALLKLLLAGNACLLLDEPTKGLDAGAKGELLELFSCLKEEGLTIVLVSHDLEFAAACADRCALLFRGEIVATGGVRPFFTANGFYTTAAHRVTQGVLEGVITVEDVEAAP